MPHPQSPLSVLLLPAQVTLSYGVFEGKLNVIKLQGPFSPEEDPSRWVLGLKLRMGGAGAEPRIQRWGTRREEVREALGLRAQSWRWRAWMSVPALSLAC